jgi:hypothetical protein
VTRFGTWSGIISNELPVIAGESYELVTQMKLNQWATASHVALEGFNASAALVNDDIGSFSYLFKERRFI